MNKILLILCFVLSIGILDGLSRNAYAGGNACFEDSSGNIFQMDVFDFQTGNNNFSLVGWAYMATTTCNLYGSRYWPMMGAAVLLPDGNTMLGLKFQSPDPLCLNQSGAYLINSLTMRGAGYWKTETGASGTVSFVTVPCDYAYGRVAYMESLP